MRISKHRNIFEKCYIAKCSKEVFVIKKVKRDTDLQTYVLEDVNGEEIVGMFYEKEL